MRDCTFWSAILLGTDIVMTALVPSVDLTLLDRAIETALSGLRPNTRRSYESNIRRWLAWQDGDNVLDREHVKRYLSSMELAGASPQVRNIALAALKRLTYECGENGWIDHQTAAQIQGIRSFKVLGQKTGKWLTQAQLRALLAACDRTTLIGRRDACVLALLAGCGLRRSEEVALSTDHIKVLNDGRMMIQNLVGKGGRIRSITVPTWAQRDIRAWMEDLAQQQTAFPQQH